MNTVIYTKKASRHWTISRVSNGQLVASMNGRRFHSLAKARGTAKKQTGVVVLEGSKLVLSKTWRASVPQFARISGFSDLKTLLNLVPNA